MPHILPFWMTETDDERQARQAAQAKIAEQKKAHEEQLHLHKLTGDKKMIQEYSSSTTDKHGHHIKRWWAVVSLEVKQKEKEDLEKAIKETQRMAEEKQRAN